MAAVPNAQLIADDCTFARYHVHHSVTEANTRLKIHSVLFAKCSVQNFVLQLPIPTSSFLDYGFELSFLLTPLL